MTSAKKIYLAVAGGLVAAGIVLAGIGSLNGVMRTTMRVRLPCGLKD